MTRRLAWANALLLGVSGLGGCYGFGDGTLASDAGTVFGTQGSAGTSSGASGVTSGGPSGLPCSIQDILQAHCTSCHSDPPVSGPMGLETYADLSAPAVTNPNETVAQLSLQRIESTVSPMPRPPAAPLTSAEIATFAAWVDAGAPPGTCGVPDAGTGDPYNTPVTCTSGKYYSGGRGSASQMHPGEACIACHTNHEGPRFTIAGTVYATAQEPKDCLGESGASVVVTDSTGSATTLTTNASGNFMTGSKISSPYTVKVVVNGKERAMTMSPPSGDCNGCHGRPPTNGAPGRVMMP